MSDNAVFGTIVRPILTERSTVLRDSHNQYFFEVRPRADKREIKKAVEELFKVQVENVRTMIVPGKFRRQGRFGDWRSDWKKAIVTVKAGQKIDFGEKAA